MRAIKQGCESMIYDISLSTNMAASHQFYIEISNMFRGNKGDRESFGGQTKVRV